MYNYPNYTSQQQMMQPNIPTQNPPPSNVMTNKVNPPQFFPEIQKLDQTQMEKLLNDEEAFNEFLMSLECIKNLKQITDSLEKENVELAKKNIAREPEYNELKQQVLNTQSELRELKMQYDQKLKLKQETMKKYSPNILLKKLVDVTNESDSKSTQIAQDFLDKKLSDKQFIEQFQKERELYHIRKTKKEHFAQQNGLQI
jgi:hypothetical protein